MEYSTKTVGEIAAAVPQSTKVFAKHGIDFCCGGKKPLAEACEGAGVPFDQVVAQIEGEVRAASDREKPADWSGSSLPDLILHILETHHVFTRDAISRLLPLSRKVAGRHGERRPELLRVAELVAALCDDLTPHLMKEEQILFPFITAMEESLSGGEVRIPPFGTVQNPIRMMMMEHETVGEILAELRAVTNGYALPDDACMSYQTFFQGMEEFEKDLHQHIHLENNVLFPRAVELEEKFTSRIA